MKDHVDRFAGTVVVESVQARIEMPNVDCGYIVSLYKRRVAKVFAFNGCHGDLLQILRAVHLWKQLCEPCVVLSIIIAELLHGATSLLVLGRFRFRAFLEFGDDARVGEGRRVAEHAAFGDVAQ